MGLAGIMLGAFFVALFIGIPIVLALLVGAVTYLVFHGNMSFSIIPIRLFRATDSYVFLSVPLFMLAGNLMNATKLTEGLIDFSDLLVGRLKGGLAHVNVVVSMFFGGCTGSAITDTSAIGTMLIPAMVEKGYEKDFSAAVTAASSTMGPIIPPSLAFILYGGVANVSVRDLFIAGIVPGILVGLSQMVVVAYYSHKRNYPKRTKGISLKEGIKIFKEAIWGLLMPVIILGGIMAGIFTPTESAGIAALYALLVGLFVYKDLTPRKLLNIVIKTGIESGAIMIIVAAAALFGWVLAMEQVPMKFAELILTWAKSPWQALLLVNFLLFVLGMFMDSAPAIVLVAPILIPLYNHLGLHPIQAGMITCVNLVTGLATPPVGCCLFAASTIAKESYEKVSLAILPFIAANIAVVLLITYIPQVTLFVPRLFGIQ